MSLIVLHQYRSFHPRYTTCASDYLKHQMQNNMSLVVRKPVFGISDQVRHKPQKMARGLKFRIKEVEGLCYPCGENKGADQLRGYREADLRLCFRICKKPVFS